MYVTSEQMLRHGSKIPYTFTISRYMIITIAQIFPYHPKLRHPNVMIDDFFQKF